MKVRIQHVLGGQWFDLCERVITERRSRTVRVPAVGEYARTFSISTGKVLYEFENYRIHPDDVPALASLQPRLAKTKPMDLNAHPMADVLREVCAAREHVPADAILDPVDGALSECLNTAYDIEGDRHARLLRIARVALAGLAVLTSEQKGGG